jgi:zinc transport system ATP-binding protein
VGEFVGIAGPNGGGKTTLLRVALGLEQPGRGTVRLFGRVPGGRRGPRVGYVPQRAQVTSATPVTVREVVQAGRLAVRGPLGPLRRADHDVVAWAIERLGLAGRSNASLRTLSGGLQQRAFIARSRLVLLRGRIVFDGDPADLPAVWHDPSHEHDH